MQISDEEKRRALLKETLLELSHDQETLKDRSRRSEYYRRFEEIYYNPDGDNFRHYYTDIFAVLTLINGDKSLGNLDILAQNIQTIKDGYIQKSLDLNGNTINVKKEIIKLYDHTNLDIARINYTQRMNEESLSELSKTKLLVALLDDKLKEPEESRQKAIEALDANEHQLSEDIRTSQEKMQNEYITILGIFAAIVLSFTGGITFSSSVLENLHRASIYRILGVISLLGFVVINLFWLLIDFIRDINGKSIRKRWFIILIDAILIINIIFIFIAYKNDWLKRNIENVQESFIETEVQT